MRARNSTAHILALLALAALGVWWLRSSAADRASGADDPLAEPTPTDDGVEPDLIPHTAFPPSAVGTGVTIDDAPLPTVEPRPLSYPELFPTDPAANAWRFPQAQFYANVNGGPLLSPTKAGSLFLY